MKRAIFVVAILAGCDETIQRQRTPMQTPIGTATSIVVRRVATFDDGLAYNGQRGIYEIEDTSTGERWIGVSGIGISERGSHSTGKTVRSDER